jgi:hypothetical protein
MSEQNILNPTTTSPLNPDYSLKITDPQVVSRWQARSGRPSFRRLAARGEVFELTWGKRLFADYLTLLAWMRQYENDYFSFIDWDHGGRYYTGMFADQPQFTREGFNQVTINAQFVVVPTLPMFQYPTNWAQDAIFLEERAGFGDLVKLTGTWDRHESNYLLWSESFDNAAWSKNTGVSITPDVAADPLGATTADRISYNGTGVVDTNRVLQNAAGAAAIFPSGFNGTGSVWLRTESGTRTVRILTNMNSLAQFVACNLTSSWQRFATIPAAGTGALVGDMRIYSDAGDNTAFTIDAWGAQLEFGSAMTAYSKTTSATSLLSAPNSNVNLHGGFAYFNGGTLVSDAAEWNYFGYGFQLYAYKGPDMGIMNVFLDGVSLGTVDLYAAAPTASAVVWTQPNTSLGIHRVKVSPTNTKNASSVAFIICADALQVMR